MNESMDEAATSEASTTAYDGKTNQEQQYEAHPGNILQILFGSTVQQSSNHIKLNGFCVNGNPIHSIFLLGCPFFQNSEDY